MAGLRSKMLLLLGTVLLCLASAEVLLRIWTPQALRELHQSDYVDSERGKFCRYDPTLGWDGKPEAEGTFEWADCVSHVRQNRHGYRGPDYPFERSDRTRIVVLGDSFVWGFGVEEEELFTRVLERESTHPLEVVNLGVSGFGTDQEYLLWTLKGKRWKPDWVVLAFTCANDLIEIAGTEAYGYPKPAFWADDGGGLHLANVPVPQRARDWTGAKVANPARSAEWVRSVTGRSQLASLVLASGLAFPALRNRLETWGWVPGASFDTADQLFEVTPRPAVVRQWELAASLLRALKADVEKSGARLLLLAIPSVAQVDPELWSRFTRGRQPPASRPLDVTLPGERLRAIAAGLDLEVVDLLPVLQESARQGPPLYFRVNQHWTARGHQIVARALLPRLGLESKANGRRP